MAIKDFNLDPNKIQKNSDNIMLNAFRIAVNGALSLFNMIDGVVDEYEDETGIDNTASLNEDYDSTDDFYTPSVSSLTTSPYAHYKCNDDAGSTVVTDDGTGVNNGVSSTNTSNLSVVGKINDAFELVRASTENIHVDALVTDIASDTTGSFAFWLNPNNVSTAPYIMHFRQAGLSGQMQVYASNTLFKVYIASSTGNYVLWSQTGFATGWHHWVVVQNGTSLVVYKDGVDVTDSSPTIAGTGTVGMWLNTTSIDQGRLGCLVSAGGVDSESFDGELDDFRYYQNKALTEDEVGVIYNGGDGTEADQPTGSPKNMTLISEPVVAESAPDDSRMVMLEEDVDVITLNTDIKAYASNDDGANWYLGTLSDEGDYDTSKRILVADFDVSAQTDTDMVYKITTLNNKDLKIHATALSWK